MDKTLLLIDASFLFHRTWYVHPNDFDTIVFLFAKKIRQLRGLFTSPDTIVVFDTTSSVYRTKLLPSYKGHRPPKSEAMIDCLLRLQQWAKETFDKDFYAVPGVEADDVIATLATTRYDQYDAIVIVTGDKDMCQLIDDKISIIHPYTGEWKTKSNFKAKNLIEPSQVVDFLAMVGDDADNISGLSGVGKATATALLRKYCTIEGIYENIGELSVHQQRLFEEARDRLSLNRKLVTLIDVELPQRVPPCRTS